MAISSKCMVQKQAITVARSGCEEWKDRQRNHERRECGTDEDKDIDEETHDGTTKRPEETGLVSEAVMEDQGMELEDQNLTSNCGGTESFTSSCV